MHGVILGTAAYMSPEQAKGKAVDKRADIWAFGCVLYEMLTGKRAFKGDDVTDIITSVMRDTPDWSALPPHTPPSIRTLLRRCLEKDPRKRVPHIAIARLEIDEAMASTGELMQGPVDAPARGVSYTAMALIALACIAVTAGGRLVVAARPGGGEPAGDPHVVAAHRPEQHANGRATPPDGDLAEQPLHRHRQQRPATAPDRSARLDRRAQYR